MAGPIDLRWNNAKERNGGGEMKRKIVACAVLTSLLLLCMCLPVSANSSWHWLTETIPFDILPYVVVLTLLIEYVVIKKVNRLPTSVKPLIVICLANLVSFLLPYARLLKPSSPEFTFEMLLHKMPNYMVGFGYLTLTLMAEVPIIYFSFKNAVSSKKKLLISIVAVNAVTTAMVAVVERVFCRGEW